MWRPTYVFFFFPLLRLNIFQAFLHAVHISHLGLLDWALTRSSSHLCTRSRSEMLASQPFFFSFFKLYPLPQKYSFPSFPVSSLSFHNCVGMLLSSHKRQSKAYFVLPRSGVVSSIKTVTWQGQVRKIEEDGLPSKWSRTDK